MMHESTTLRWGIMGCARISRRGLIPGIQQSINGSLLAIASRDGATAQAWADEFGTRIAEQFLALFVGQMDDAVLGDDQEGVRRALQYAAVKLLDFAQSLLARFQFFLLLLKLKGLLLGVGEEVWVCKLRCKISRLNATMGTTSSNNFRLGAESCRNVAISSTPSNVSLARIGTATDCCGAADPRPDSMRR